MLESIFIFMAAIAFVLFVLGIFEKSITFSAMSLITWIIVMANSLFVEVPADTDYSEIGFSAFCLAFIFANILWIIIQYLEFRFERGMP